MCTNVSQAMGSLSLLVSAHGLDSVISWSWLSVRQYPGGGKDRLIEPARTGTTQYLQQMVVANGSSEGHQLRRCVLRRCESTRQTQSWSTNDSVRGSGAFANILCSRRTTLVSGFPLDGNTRSIGGMRQSATGTVKLGCVQEPPGTIQRRTPRVA
jgi:hypothetical protein